MQVVNSVRRAKYIHFLPKLKRNAFKSLRAKSFGVINSSVFLIDIATTQGKILVLHNIYIVVVSFLSPHSPGRNMCHNDVKKSTSVGETFGTTDVN